MGENFSCQKACSAHCQKSRWQDEEYYGDQKFRYYRPQCRVPSIDQDATSSGNVAPIYGDDKSLQLGNVLLGRHSMGNTRLKENKLRANTFGREPLGDAALQEDRVFARFRCSEIFDACNVNRSLVLSERELKFALQACGFYPSKADLEQFMEEVMDCKAFQDLVANLSNGDSSCPKGPVAVPPAWRGTSLAQLKRLLESAVESEWLTDKCEEFNACNAASIFTGQQHKMIADLHALSHFVIRKCTDPDTSRSLIRENQHLSWLPQSDHPCSFSELLNPEGLSVHFFLSHYWGQPYARTVRALQQWVLNHNLQLVAECIPSDDVVFWISLFALNQHTLQDDIGLDLGQGPFHAAILQASLGAIMILDEEMQPFSRIWCLYEVHCIGGYDVPLQLLSADGMPLSSLLEDAGPNAKQSAMQLEAVGNALAQISARDAKSSSESDKLAIMHQICAQSLRNLPLSVMLQIGLFDRPKAFAHFERSVQATIATGLFKVYIQNEDLDGCLRYLGLGANLDSGQDLQTLKMLGLDPANTVVAAIRGPNTTENCSLLHCAADFGHQHMAELLLNSNADVNGKTVNGTTPLHRAAERGCYDLTKLLIDRGATVNQLTCWGASSLVMASTGPADIVSLLLSRNADLHAAFTSAPHDILPPTDKADPPALERHDHAWRGYQAIHGAAQYGCEANVRVLLEYRANSMAMKADGCTPLYLAAGSGQRHIVELLQRRGAIA